ncbi:MAG TPA: Rab family GTPase [Candidatus Limnocylindrales bacterium]|jgi:small GTP-binding protein|nr:Rab family GTPase [Candidatus Limnocylindrales bacterium]
MLQKKICMLGSFAVGKTSLVRRFVESIYSDVYQTTVGVKIDKKNMQVEGKEVSLVLWDIYGEDDYQKMRWTYLRGASGYLLVADGTRKTTLEKAVSVEQRVREEVGVIPFVLVLNKSDLLRDWELDPALESQLAANGWNIRRSSAKTGEGVEESFTELARKMLG